MLKEKRNVLRENSCQLRLLYPSKLSFKNKGKIKTFPDKQNRKNNDASRYPFKKILKAVLRLKASDLRW